MYTLVSDVSLRSRATAWVAIQGPFSGSPVVEKLKWISGDFGEALRDLSTTERTAYLTTWREEVRAVTEQIVVRSCYTTYRGLSSMLALDNLSAIMSARGIDSDGLILVT